eukprot:TRINITY_DN23457_c0_g1_i1.p1 TRINITY_DN23457_c0_g1~~TRINITY_DN23457_c0_g1_i1.p1  ORF type:complete len:217 (-),score=15.55 TRINITY_DN23457_c0_g1_i1:76-726(-)
MPLFSPTAPLKMADKHWPMLPKVVKYTPHFMGSKRPYSMVPHPRLDGIVLTPPLLHSKGTVVLRQNRHCKVELQRYYECVNTHKWKNACWNPFMSLMKCDNLSRNEGWRPKEAREDVVVPRFYEFLNQVLIPEYSGRSMMRHYFDQQYSHDMRPLEDTMSRAKHVGAAGPKGTSSVQWGRFMNMSMTHTRKDTMFSPGHPAPGPARPSGNPLPMMW